MSDQHDPANPYAPPAASEHEWEPTAEPSKPTAAPKVFGILSIVFASLVLLFGLLASCSGFAGQSLSSMGQSLQSGSKASEQARVMMSHMGTIYMAIGVQGMVFTIMSALLLAIGVGQLRYRRWACKWSTIWSVLALVVLAGMVALAFLVIGPAYERMFQALASSSPSGALPASFGTGISRMFGGTSAVMMAIFYAPYPVLLLIYFSREQVIAAMNK